ncbi:hypothetical protein [Deinococcus radiotolerans]|uniref:hypothetical protein n=1 Tax=Deinococcus radiotolerans TaxID=1309407 RepID=UPI001669E919|nr:hypothetical protein [Deinococcus radiotolerans]
MPATGQSLGAATRDGVIERAREALALKRLDEPDSSDHLRRPDVSDLLRHSIPDDAQPVTITPAPINPLSLEVRRAIEASTLSTEAIARQLNTGHWVILRMMDPFYWKHSLVTLRELADALQLTVQVTLIPAEEQARKLGGTGSAGRAPRTSGSAP